MRTHRPAIKSVSSTDYKTSRIMPAVRGEGFRAGGFVTIHICGHTLDADDVARRVLAHHELMAFANAYIAMAADVTARGATARPTFAQLNKLRNSTSCSIRRAPPSPLRKAVRHE